MSNRCWALYLWPGLPQLWVRGNWSGLLLALGCAALLNVLVAASFVWHQLLDSSLLTFGWVALGLIWVGSPLFGAGDARPTETVPAAGEDLFRQAQGEYLRGNWYEAEGLLARQLRRQPGDVESRLLLATLLRHIKRYDEAHRELAHLEKLEGAVPWTTEIAAERHWLDELSAAGKLKELQLPLPALPAAGAAQ
jgi:hypothetical protein